MKKKKSFKIRLDTTLVFVSAKMRPDLFSYFHVKLLDFGQLTLDTVTRQNKTTYYY